MPSRGRHQSSSKECLRSIKKIESIPGVIGVIIGRSLGGKSLGASGRTGAIKVQRREDAGLKAVTQTAKGLQELFIRIEKTAVDNVVEAIEKLN